MLLAVGSLGKKSKLEPIPSPDLQLNFDQASIGANAAPDDAIDFSRASQATFTDSDGLVKYAPHNLCLQSEDMGTTWGLTNTTVNTNATTAPDGTTTADKITENTSTGAHTCNISLSSTDPTGFTSYSAYFKTDGRDEVSVRLDSATTNYILVLFNISTGTIVSQSDNGNGTLESSSITDVGNGWFRVTISGIIDTSGSTLRVLNSLYNASSSYTGDGTSGLFMWGVQVSKHRFIPIGNPYIKTTTAAVYGARLEHQPGYFLSANQAQNLVAYSEDFSNRDQYVGWETVNFQATSTQVTVNQIADPNGDITADYFSATDPVSGFCSIKHRANVNKGNAHIASIYVKGKELTSFNFQVYNYNKSTNTRTFITAINPTNISTTEWARFDLTMSSGQVTEDYLEIVFLLGGGGAQTWSGEQGLYIWGAQLEVGSSVGTYVKTEGLPYYGGGATQNGLLIEEQRTNLLLYSETFDLSSGSGRYYPNNTTITANQAISPSGTLTADKMTETTAAPVEGGNQNNKLISPSTVAVTSGKKYSMSVYVKRATGTRNIDIRTNSSNGAFAFSKCAFDLSTGVAINSNSYPVDGFSITNVGNGWFRCSITKIATATANSSFSIVLNNASNTNSYAGDGSSSVFLWGLQSEEGAFPTSYIPTTSATVTRSADLATMGPVTGTNLILQSEDLSTTWSTARGTVTANNTTAPDGLTTADKFGENTDSGIHGVIQQVNASAATVYVMSVYLRSDERTFGYIRPEVLNSGSFVGGFTQIFDINNKTVESFGGFGTAPTLVGASIVDAGDGWVKASVGIQMNASGVNQLKFITGPSSGASSISYAGSTGSGIHIWGAQLEQAPTLITGAEDFSAWAASNSSVSTNVIAAPDGNTTADKIVENTANTSHYVFIPGFTLDGNKTYTASVFAKKAERSFLRIGASTPYFSSGSAGAIFNLTDGTVVVGAANSPTATITDVGNDWFRCTMTFLTDNTATSQLPQIGTVNDDGTSIQYTGDGSSGLYLWGAQVEEGASATPYPPEPTKYLPTYASTNLPFVGYNHNQGTIDTRFTMLGFLAFARMYEFNDGSDSANESFIVLQRGASFPNQGFEQIATGGANQIFNEFDNSSNSLIKHAIAYKADDVSRQMIDGSGSVDSFTDTSVTLPSTIDELGIGSNPDGGGAVGVLIFKRFHYYASRLKNDFLKRLR